MNTKEVIDLAKKYLEDNKIPFVQPGTIGMTESERVEVIFLMPEALNPNMVVDPPDNRVWVNTKTKEVTWIYQM